MKRRIFGVMALITSINSFATVISFQGVPDGTDINEPFRGVVSFSGLASSYYVISSSPPGPGGDFWEVRGYSYPQVKDGTLYIIPPEIPSPWHESGMTQSSLAATFIQPVRDIRFLVGTYPWSVSFSYVARDGQGHQITGGGYGVPYDLHNPLPTYVDLPPGYGLTQITMNGGGFTHLDAEMVLHYLAFTPVGIPDQGGTVLLLGSSLVGLLAIAGCRRKSASRSRKSTTA